MQRIRKIAVAGATGRVGKHVVDVVRERGHEAVPMARATGVDVISGAGLEAALQEASAEVGRRHTALMHAGGAGSH